MVGDVQKKKRELANMRAQKNSWPKTKIIQPQRMVNLQMQFGGKNKNIERKGQEEKGNGKEKKTSTKIVKTKLGQKGGPPAKQEHENRSIGSRNVKSSVRVTGLGKGFRRKSARRRR